MAAPKVLVTGANGFVGESVCQKFCLEGWETYGLVRSVSNVAKLSENEIIPLIGSPGDISFLENIRNVQFDAIVSTTEDMFRYETHFEDIISLAIAVSAAANQAGKKPLLLFTTGAKDTGPSGLLSAKDFVVTNESTIPKGALPINVVRFNIAQRVFNYADNFHAIIVRPTLIYGRSASWYGTVLYQAATSNQIVLYGSKEVVWHGVHVDDVAQAYFLIASKIGSQGHGELYNVANDNFETLGAIATAVSKEYGVQHNMIFKQPETGKLYQELISFSHAMSAEKLKLATGWTQKKPSFIDGLKSYRMAYDEALKKGDTRALRMIGFMQLADVRTEDAQL